MRLAILLLATSAAAAPFQEPPGWGELPYLFHSHYYDGSYWTLGDCDEPWFLAQQERWRAENCHECNHPEIPDSWDCPPGEDPITPTGEEVPEPGTLALLGAALIGLALMRRGR